MIEVKRIKIEERMREAQESIRKLVEAADASSDDENSPLDLDIRNDLPDMNRAEEKLKSKIEDRARSIQHKFN